MMAFNQEENKLKSPRGIWYSPVSGIWQTVWLEPVNEKHISKLHTITDIDNQSVNLNFITSYDSVTDSLELIVKENDKILSKMRVQIDSEINIPIKNPKLWSPESPFLYDLEIKLISNGKVVDRIKSYFGMRKISIKKDVKWHNAYAT